MKRSRVAILFLYAWQVAWEDCDCGHSAITPAALIQPCSLSSDVPQTTMSSSQPSDPVAGPSQPKISATSPNSDAQRPTKRKRRALSCTECIRRKTRVRPALPFLTGHRLYPLLELIVLLLGLPPSAQPLVRFRASRVSSAANRATVDGTTSTRAWARQAQRPARPRSFCPPPPQLKHCAMRLTEILCLSSSDYLAGRVRRRSRR